MSQLCFGNDNSVAALPRSAWHLVPSWPSHVADPAERAEAMMQPIRAAALLRVADPRRLAAVRPASAAVHPAQVGHHRVLVVRWARVAQVELAAIRKPAAQGLTVPAQVVPQRARAELKTQPNVRRPCRLTRTLARLAWIPRLAPTTP